MIKDRSEIGVPSVSRLEIYPRRGIYQVQRATLLALVPLGLLLGQGFHLLFVDLDLS